MRKLDQALAKLHRYVKDQKLFCAGAKILLCCSGGADSVAMLQLFSRLRAQMHITLLAVHVDHQLRGAESDADVELVKQICLSLNIPLIVRKIKLDKREGLENQARKKRFASFREILELYRFDRIATAHHKNDQAETMLMNLLRGAGINGLAGIKPSSGVVIHPLLCFSKQELVDLLTEEGVPWREDSSNSDNTFRRNKIRNELLPLIIDSINPAAVEKLSEQAKIFLETEQLLQAQAQKHLKRTVLEQSGEAITLSLDKLEKLSRVEQYYVIKAAMASIGASEQDFFMHGFEEIIRLTASSGSKQTKLGNKVFVRKQYRELTLSSAEFVVSIPEPLSVEEDRCRAVYGDYRFSFKILKVLPKKRDEGGFRVYLDADKVRFPFTIRSRQEGDRFIPLGMKQQKRLKEFFIDQKVPKFERDSIPLFDDGEKIFWVVGHRLDARVAIDSGSQRYLHVTAELVHEKPKRAASRIKKFGEDNESYEL